MPFVPVIGYVPGGTINPRLGYEMWVSRKDRATPYILEISASEYQKLPEDSLYGHACKLCDGYINIPLLALYDTIEQAKYALCVFTPVRTKEQLRAAQ